MMTKDDKDQAAGCIIAGITLVSVLLFLAVCAVLVRIIIWAVIG